MVIVFYFFSGQEVFFVVDSVKCTDREAIAISVPPSTHGYRFVAFVALERISG